MRTENWVSTSNAVENSKNTFVDGGENRDKTFCGRTYNEENDFSQANFAAFQTMLDQRNQLLSGVKANKLP